MISTEPAWTRDDTNPVAGVFADVCREQIGRVPAMECYVCDSPDPDPEKDAMRCKIVLVTGAGRIDIGPFTLVGQSGMTDAGWYASLRTEMRRWFKGHRKAGRQ